MIETSIDISVIDTERTEHGQHRGNLDQEDIIPEPLLFNMFRSNMFNEIEAYMYIYTISSRQWPFCIRVLNELLPGQNKTVLTVVPCIRFGSYRPWRADKKLFTWAHIVTVLALHYKPRSHQIY